MFPYKVLNKNSLYFLVAVTSNGNVSPRELNPYLEPTHKDEPPFPYPHPPFLPPIPPPGGDYPPPHPHGPPFDMPPGPFPPPHMLPPPHPLDMRPPPLGGRMSPTFPDYRGNSPNRYPSPPPSDKSGRSDKRSYDRDHHPGVRNRQYSPSPPLHRPPPPPMYDPHARSPSPHRRHPPHHPLNDYRGKLSLSSH